MIGFDCRTKDDTTECRIVSKKVEKYTYICVLLKNSNTVVESQLEAKVVRRIHMNNI